MFGFIGKKKEKKTVPADSGLMYAGSPTKQEKEVDIGELRHTYKVQEGSLEMHDTVMRLVTKEGVITVQYDTIDAWDYDGKSFRVWYTVGSHNYTFTCKPEMSPEDELKKILHKSIY